MVDSVWVNTWLGSTSFSGYGWVDAGNGGAKSLWTRSVGAVEMMTYYLDGAILAKILRHYQREAQASGSPNSR